MIDSVLRLRRKVERGGKYVVFGVGCDSLPAVIAREPLRADQVETLGRQ